MGLEAATYISQLTATNPASGDQVKQGDDHIRLTKSVLQTTFPNADRPFRFPEFLTKSADYTVLAADDNKSILCDTTSAFTLTLPTPTFDGWLVRVVKGTTDTNPVYVAPPSGTINGFAKVRINVPYVEYVFIWTGSVFIRISPFGVPAGVSEDFHGATAPVGYALCYGQTLSGVAGDYPELNSALGGIVLPDLRGVVSAGKDDMGGSDAARLGSTALGALVGAKSHTLTGAESGQKAYSGAVDIYDPQHKHNVPIPGGTNLSGSVGRRFAGSASNPGDTNGDSDFAATGITASITIAAANAASAHNNVQATRVVNKIMRLC